MKSIYLVLAGELIRFVFLLGGGPHVFTACLSDSAPLGQHSQEAAFATAIRALNVKAVTGIQNQVNPVE